jgi:hypothetical protein
MKKKLPEDMEMKKGKNPKLEIAKKAKKKKKG